MHVLLIALHVLRFATLHSIVPVTGSVRELKGLFRGRGTKPVTLEEMDRAIAKGASRSR